MSDHLNDPLPAKLGEIIKAHPLYLRLLELGPPDPDPPARCPICRDLGFLRHDVAPGEPHFGTIVSCECRRPSIMAARVSRLWANAQAPSGYDDHTLESFPGDQAVVDALRTWLDQTEWLVLEGPVGAGKTGLSVALLRLFAETGLSVLFVNTPVMLRRVRATYGSDEGPSETDVIDSLGEVDVLALDDLGKERLTPWASELVYDVVNRRYSINRRTIITSNLDVKRLAAHVGEATSSRIFERSLWVTVSGNLRRPRRA